MKYKRAFALSAILVCLGCALMVTGLAIASPRLTTEGTGSVVLTGPTSAHIVNQTGQYGAVYHVSRSKKLLRKLIHLSFISDGDVAGGAPRWSIPVNSDGDPTTTEGFAFIDAAACGATTGPADAVFPHNTTVSPGNPACHVFYSGDGQTYTNWEAFVGKTGAHPTWTLSFQTPADPIFPFIIADQPGDYTIYAIRATS
jgi:hypothetical protein